MELISVSIKGGYMKKILKVNLKKGKFDSQELEEDYAAKYIGGAGYANALQPNRFGNRPFWT